LRNTSLSLLEVGLLVGIAIVSSVIGTVYFVSLTPAATMRDMDSATSARIQELDSKISTLTFQLRSDSEQIAAMTQRIESLQHQLNSVVRRIESLEKLELTTAYSGWICPWYVDIYRNLWMGWIPAGLHGWSITLTVKNAGVLDAEVNDMLIDNKFLTSPLSAYPEVYVEIWRETVDGYLASAAGNIVSPIMIGAGQKVRIRLLLPREPFSSGQTVTVTLVTTTGHAYSKAITLP